MLQSTEEPDLIEVKKETTLEWEVVDNSYRQLSRIVDLKNPLTEALREGKTIRIPKGARIDRYYRWAKANNLNLHRRGFEQFNVIWLENDVESPAEA